RALDLEPDSAEARYHLGFVLARLGQHDAALREARRAMEASPFVPVPRFRLAIDLLFERAEVLAPELNTDAALAAGQPVPDFAIDPAALAPLFEDFQPPMPLPPQE